MSYRPRLLSLTAAALVSQLGFLDTAMAQQAGAAAAPAAEEKKSVVEEITVTGTRIRRKDLNTPAPVTVISSEQITSSGKVSLGDFLQSLPEQGNAINTQVNNGGDGTTTVNLRSLGDERTLVLLNGRRFVAGGVIAGSTVDLNSIPAAAIERIEVLKDGASAVYGSDAIAGVVNIITKKRMDGTEASAYAGQTSRRDGKTIDLSLTTGTSSDKGSVLFSVGYTKIGTIWAGDRAWAAKAANYAYNDQNYLGFVPGESAGGSSAIPEGRFSLGQYFISPTGGVCARNAAGTACDGGDIADGNSVAYQLLSSRLVTGATDLQNRASYRSLNFLYSPGSAGAIQNYIPYSAAVHPYNYQAVNYLVQPATRIQLFSTGDANVGNFARAYFEASYVNRTSRQQIAPDPIFTGNYGVVMSRDSMYNPTGVDLYDVRRRMNEFGGRANDQDVTTYRVVLGLDGTLPAVFGPLQGWFWDGFFNWGRTTGTDTNSGALRLPYLQNALGPSFNRNGTPVCGNRGPDGIAGNDDDVVIDGCVPLNLLHANVPGGTEPNAANLAALGFNGTDRGLNQMQQIGVNASGEIARLMSDRPISLAFGGDYTKYKAWKRVNTINAAGEGDNFNSSDVGGDYTTTQAYAELSIPILSNQQFVEDLELSAAARFSKYSTFGNNTSFKAGLKYAPVRDVVIRGTYSTAFRAPGIVDLYSGQTESFPQVSDPCSNLANATPAVIANCQKTGLTALGGSGDQSSQLKELIGGNPDLTPEKAKIFTVGAVFQPRMLRGFSATVDYFRTEVDNTIGAIGAANILSGCIARGYDPYCAAIHRDPTTQLIIQIDDLQANYSKLEVSGVDVGVRYALPTPYGKFGFQADAAFLIKLDQKLPSGQVITGKGTYDLGTNPSVKANIGLSYGYAGFGAGWTTRYFSSFKECSNNNPSDDFFNTATSGLCYTGGAAFTGPEIGWGEQFSRTVPSYFLHDLYLSYAHSSSFGKTSLQAGIQNVLDKSPPRIYSSFLTYADYDYQFPGRSFYARLTQNF